MSRKEFVINYWRENVEPCQDMSDDEINAFNFERNCK